MYSSAPSATRPSGDDRRAAKLAELKSAAEAPGASRLARDRYRFAQQSGMYAQGGKVQTSADTARKLATEMGGMKDGGEMKPVKKAVGGTGKMRKGMAPIKRAQGGTVRIDLEEARRATTARDRAKEEERYRRAMGSQKDILKRGERVQGEEAREKPVKRAKGGAGKVRKGMMTPEGDIKKAVKPKKGIGGYM